MKKVTIVPGQTLIDIALQELGDAATLFEVAQYNDRSITDDLAAGDVLTVPDYALDRRAIVSTFANLANRPASGITTASETDGIFGEGIEFWSIELDFVIQ